MEWSTTGVPTLIAIMEDNGAQRKSTQMVHGKKRTFAIMRQTVAPMTMTVMVESAMIINAVGTDAMAGTTAAVG